MLDMNSGVNGVPGPKNLTKYCILNISEFVLLKIYQFQSLNSYQNASSFMNAMSRKENLFVNQTKGINFQQEYVFGLTSVVGEPSVIVVLVLVIIIFCCVLFSQVCKRKEKMDHKSPKIIDGMKDNIFDQMEDKTDDGMEDDTAV